MIRSPLEFGDNYVGEPEPPRRWRRPIEEVIARVLVFVAIFLTVTFLSLGCAPTAGRDAIGAVAIVVVWLIILGVLWFGDPVGRKERRP